MVACEVLHWPGGHARLIPPASHRGSDLSSEFYNFLVARSRWRSTQRRWAAANGHGQSGQLMLVRSSAGPSGGDGSGITAPKSRLQGIVKRKQMKLASQLKTLGVSHMEERLASFPAPSAPEQLLELIAEKTVAGRTTVVAEVGRVSPAETSAEVAERAARYVAWGADAIAVCTDEEVSSDGLQDLTAVSKRLPQVPLICKDWVLHPLQILDAVEAGAASLNLVQAVLRPQGIHALQGLTLRLGAIPIVEVINLKEVRELSDAGGCPLFGVNLSVGLSVPIPGFREDIAKALVQELPFGAASMVGVSSIQEACTMKAAGADAVWFKREALQPPKGANGSVWDEGLEKMFEELVYVMSGDD